MSPTLAFLVNQLLLNNELNQDIFPRCAVSLASVVAHELGGGGIFSPWLCPQSGDAYLI
jgi:hypothetical protein